MCLLDVNTDLARIIEILKTTGLYKMFLTFSFVGKKCISSSLLQVSIGILDLMPNAFLIQTLLPNCKLTESQLQFWLWLCGICWSICRNLTYWHYWILSIHACFIVFSVLALILIWRIYFCSIILVSILNYIVSSIFNFQLQGIKI